MVYSGWRIGWSTWVGGGMKRTRLLEELCCWSVFVVLELSIVSLCVVEYVCLCVFTNGFRVIS